ncbi:MAG: HD domain-containing protein [Ruminococcus sp.]|nr:HD domain-containing protein [Ruminococcus sp.]
MENYKIILQKLADAGYQAFLVGGCVRDKILGREVHDYDITTDALPEQIIEVFSGFRTVPTGIKHGTVTVIAEGQPFEVTTFRIDGKYSDSRRPDSVSFTGNLIDDLARRDFTMNAVAMDIDGKIYDPFGGREDIENKIIKCVGEPALRFNEDALRILRAVRFSSVLGFGIEENTSSALMKLRGKLDGISRERIREELDKLICGENLIPVMLGYREIIAQIIPEMRACFDFDQRSHFHMYNVYEHIVRSMNSAPKNSPFLRRVMLFHDIGKPPKFTVDENGEGHFKGHAGLSADMCREIMKNLRYDNNSIERTCLLIAHHSDKIHNDVQIKRLVSQIGEGNFFLLMQIKRFDNYGKRPFVLKEFEEFERHENALREFIRNNECMHISQLEINGNDLKNLGFSGRAVGDMLGELLDNIIEGRLENQRDLLLEYASRGNLRPCAESERNAVK